MKPKPVKPEPKTDTKVEVSKTSTKAILSAKNGVE